jgi:O-antigen ligase
MNRSPSTRFGSEGFLHWMFPLMLGLIAVTILLSGRDLSQMFLDLAKGTETPAHPAQPWLQRMVSLLLLLICAERLLDHFLKHKPWPAPWLAAALVTYWAATVALPALFGSRPRVSHEYVYALVISLAALLSTAAGREHAVASVRTTLFLFLLGGVLLVPVQPALVLDMNYDQGLLPGVPRFGGLAPHPVALGFFAQIFLLCLWARPFEKRWLTVFAWILGLGVLFLAQSKTAWIAFLLCSLAMLAVRQGAVFWRRVSDPRDGAFGIAMCMAFMFVVATLLGALLFSELPQKAGQLLDTPEGAQLVSMTGRDQIWAVALQEWRASPVFGYGPTIWDDDHRASIGMPHATSGHNQFMDTLARSGTVGAIALVLYALVLLVLSLATARATGGLSLALFIALALRSVSEVPLVMLGYGTELLTHVLLIITLASARSTQPTMSPATSRLASLQTAT